MEQALIGALSAILVLVVKGLLDRRTSRATAVKTEAEAGLVIDQRWERLADEYGERLGRAEADVEALKGRVAELERSLHVSEAQVRSLTQLLRSTVRWALTLRDEVLKLGGHVPPMPADLEFALTTLDTE